MPDADYYIRENDTGGSITATLTDADGNAVSIQLATVIFQMTPIGDLTRTAKVQAAANNDQTGDGSDGSKGDVSYDWAAADTDTPGLYLAEWQVTFTGGAVQTYPNDDYTLVRVTPEATPAAAS